LTGDAHDFSQLAAQHASLRQRMPRSWNAYFGRFGTLRPVQLEAMPPILAGENVLVTAPTAGGKTEAGLAPICERLAQNDWRGLSVLVVTPTRALVNDIYARLSAPCDAMQIALGRKTADHAIPEMGRVQVLVTTPESTESMLTFRRDLLSQVRAVVLDEIHLLDGSPRGDHLRMLLARLERYRAHVDGEPLSSMQRVAMSATVNAPMQLAAAYLGPHARIVTVGGQRTIDARVVLAQGTEEDRAHAAITAAESFEDVRKILVFVNSRKQVDSGTACFRSGRFSRTPVYGHHGSLSKHQREEVESRFKNDQHAICVATMTLEVGIDIGDIDLVICMDPPFSMPSFLQRIGRGCRRLKGLTRVVCVARDRASELMFQAMVRQASIGLPPTPQSPFRRSVLVQQSLAYLQQVERHRRTIDQFKNVLLSDALPPVTEDVVVAVLDDMVRSEMLDRQAGVYRPASLGWSFIQSKKIYANIQSTPMEIALVDVDSGKRIATISGLRDPSTGVSVGGRPYEVLRGRSPAELRVRKSEVGAGDAPRYHARHLPYAGDIGAMLANFLGIQPQEIVALRQGSDLIVMTWLGRLFNAVLARGLTRLNCPAIEGAFHLQVRAEEEPRILDLLRQAVSAIVADNPLGEVAVDRLVDVGPHHAQLSPALQRATREDWLDAEFLERWIGHVFEVRIVDSASDLGQDFLALTI
jgi:ATP-dependent Lhr-like helicase